MKSFGAILTPLQAWLKASDCEGMEESHDSFLEEAGSSPWHSLFYFRS